jgi:hypothetical protein
MARTEWQEEPLRMQHKVQQTNQGQNRGLNPRWVNFKKALQHTLGFFASGIEKPRWVSTSRLTIVHAIKKPEMHCEGVELREEKLEGRVQRDFVGGKES